MPKFVKVAHASDLLPGEKKLVFYDGNRVGLFNIEGKLYAIGDVHAKNGASLVDGELVGTLIMSGQNGARLDVVTGDVRTLKSFAPVPTYEVRIEGSDVFISPSYV